MSRVFVLPRIAAARVEADPTAAVRFPDPTANEAAVRPDGRAFWPWRPLAHTGVFQISPAAAQGTPVDAPEADHFQLSHFPDPNSARWLPFFDGTAAECAAAMLAVNVVLASGESGFLAITRFWPARKESSPAPPGTPASTILVTLRRIPNGDRAVAECRVDVGTQIPRGVV